MKDEQRTIEAEWMHSVVEAHAANLVRYAASILGERDAARDVVQDVFLKLWQESRSSVEDHLVPWLFRVCRNRALDVRRKGGRMKPLESTYPGDPVMEAPGPRTLAEREDSHARILKLMEGLPENQQEVVRLKFQNGLSYKEIATVTEHTVSHVGFLLHTAISTLRARVAAAGE